MRKSRFALLGVLALVVGALALPATSNADPGEHSAVCTFSGATSALDDIPGIEASETDAPDGDLANDIKGIQANPFNPVRSGPSATDGTNRWLIETGGYAFTTAPPFLLPNQCLLVDVSHPASSGLKPITINANGTYKNLLCGTGSTDGTADLAITAGAPPDVTGITFNYHIDFAAGEGVAVAPPPPASSPGVGPLDTGKSTTASINGTGGGPAAGAGHVHITGIPATAGGTACGNSDARDFSVFGTFVGVQTQ